MKPKLPRIPVPKFTQVFKDKRKLTRAQEKAQLKKELSVDNID